MTPTPLLEKPRDPHIEPAFVPERHVSPWVSDQVLLTMSLWWVQSTHPESVDISTEVAAFFTSLQEELQ